MKCVIFGGSFYNKGAEAMSICVIKELYKRGICDEFNFVSFKELYEIDSIGIKKLEEKKYINQIELPRLKRLSQVLFMPKIMYTSDIKQLLMAIEESDFIIDISGYTLCDKFGVKPALSFYIRTRLAKKINKPHIIFPQAMGPFNNKKVAKLTKKSIENSELVILRDEKTYDYVEKLDIKNIDNIKLLPDIAFLFHERSRENNINGSKNIMIVPNVRAYEKSYEDRKNYYIESLINSINNLPQNVKIYLLPHEYGKCGFDDIALCKRIMKKIEKKRDVILIDKHSSAIELKDIIAKADLIITSRFHAAIAALSMSIPTITVGWADKYPQLLKLFNCEEFALDVSELKTNKLNDKVSYILNNEKEITKKLSENLIKVKSKSTEVFNLLEEFLGDKE